MSAQTESGSEAEQDEQTEAGSEKEPCYIIADEIRESHVADGVTQEEIQGERHEFYYLKLEDEYLRVKPQALSSNMPVAEMKGTRMKRFTLIQEHLKGISAEHAEIKKFGELDEDIKEHISQVVEALSVGDESSRQRGDKVNNQSADEDVIDVADDVESMSREEDARSKINPHSPDPEDQINTDAEDDLIHSGGTLREDEGY